MSNTTQTPPAERRLDSSTPEKTTVEQAVERYRKIEDRVSQESADSMDRAFDRLKKPVPSPRRLGT